jgi:hypothetical protein
MQPLNVKPVGNTPPRVDRRSGVDRRKADKGPPDGRERRRGIEPRRPEVIEREPTPSEWATLKEIVPPATKPVE